MKVLLLLALVGLISLVGAQENPLPTGVLTSKSALCLRADVAAEIGLTISQVQAVRVRMNGLNDIPINGTTGSVPALDQLDAETKKELTPEQWTRLIQIWTQFEGPFVLLDGKVSDELKIDLETSGKLTQMAEEYGAWWRSQVTRVRRTSDLKGIHVQARKVGGKMLGLLSADQKKQFEAMKGPKFKFRN